MVTQGGDVVSEGRWVTPVVILSATAKAYLGEAIDSVHARAYRPIEMMIRMPRTIRSIMGGL